MENKETALDWLINEISYQDDSETYCKFIERTDLSVYFALAKQMEKDQTLDFASKVLNKAECSWTGVVHINESLEDIYNETYGE